MNRTQLTRNEVLALPAAVNVGMAARALGIAENTAYDLIRTDEFPVPVIRLGRLIKVPSEGLRRVLGFIDTEQAEPAREVS